MLTDYPHAWPFNASSCQEHSSLFPPATNQAQEQATIQSSTSSDGVSAARYWRNSAFRGSGHQKLHKHYGVSCYQLLHN